jgi:hypothetical protein
MFVSFVFWRDSAEVLTRHGNFQKVIAMEELMKHNMLFCDESFQFSDTCILGLDIKRTMMQGPSSSSCARR